MRRKARPLIGLKHVVGPAILGGHLKIRTQVRRILNEFELRFVGTLLIRHRGTAHPIGFVHFANSIHQVTHAFPRVVRVVQIIVVCQRDRSRLNRAAGRTIVKPVARLNVVLPRTWFGAATADHAERWPTQALKEVIGCAILLNDLGKSVINRVSRLAKVRSEVLWPTGFGARSDRPDVRSRTPAICGGHKEGLERLKDVGILRSDLVLADVEPSYCGNVLSLGMFPNGDCRGLYVYQKNALRSK